MGPVPDPEFYQEFFAKLSKAVFLDAIMYVEKEASEAGGSSGPEGEPDAQGAKGAELGGETSLLPDPRT